MRVSFERCISFRSKYSVLCITLEETASMQFHESMKKVKLISREILEKA